MEMPRRSGKHGRFLANSSKKVGDEYCEIVCRVIPIMDRLFFKHPKLVVHQVKNCRSRLETPIQFDIFLTWISIYSCKVVQHNDYDFRHCGIRVQYMKDTLFSSPVIIHCVF